MDGNVNYRAFNDEESAIYMKAIDMIRTNINNGVKFDLACEFVDVKDQDLKALIIDDVLKIEIAEMHYGKGVPLRDVSKKLGVNMERLLGAAHEMMEDIVTTASESAGRHPGTSGTTTH